jgi:hypothetical protein
MQQQLQPDAPMTEIGNDTIARRPMRSMFSTTSRGRRVACKVCDRIT